MKKSSKKKKCFSITSLVFRNNLYNALSYIVVGLKLIWMKIMENLVRFLAHYFEKKNKN